MASEDNAYMYSDSLADRVNKYITRGGRPEYQNATEHPSTLAVYNEPFAKQNGATLGTFEFYKDSDGTYSKGGLGIKDPFLKLGDEIDKNVKIQAPQVKINGNKLVIQAPKEVLATPIVDQIKDELQTLKGANLDDAEVKNAIDALNKEIYTNLRSSVLKSSMGWDKDQYNDYQYLKQTMSVTNPMSSANKVKGKDKEGNIIMKTPQEWIDYYREAYNTEERTDAFEKSYFSEDPYERTLAMVMGQGGKVPVYGFDAAERMGEGWKAFVNQMGKFPEGVFRRIASSNDVQRIDSLNNDLKIPAKAFKENFGISTEEKFEEMKQSIEGKNWSQLSDAQKAFLLVLGVSKENANERPIERGMLGEGRYRAEDLRNMSSENDYTSRWAIRNILLNNSFDRYKQIKNDVDTWQGYDDWSKEDEKKLEKTAIWSGNEQWWGNVAGTVARFAWENAVVKGLTGGLTNRGGLSMSSISDKIGGSYALGTGIVGSLAKRGFVPTSAFGKNVMQLAANLIGTVPEDIIQTSVDNVLTYHDEENKNLFDLGSMSESFKNNLQWMALCNAVRAGFSAVKSSKLAQKMKKNVDLDQKINIDGMNESARVGVKTIENGGHIEVNDGKIYAVDVSGNKVELKDITVENAKVLQKAMENFDSTSTAGKEAGDASSVNAPRGKFDRFNSLSDAEVENAVLRSGKQFQTNLKKAILKWRMRRLDGALEQIGLGKKTADGKTVKIDASSYFKKNNIKSMSEVPGGIRDFIISKQSAAKNPNVVVKTLDDIAEEATGITDVKYTADSVNSLLNDYAKEYNKPITGAEIKQYFSENPDAEIVSWTGKERGTGNTIIKREGLDYLLRKAGGETDTAPAKDVEGPSKAEGSPTQTVKVETETPDGLKRVDTVDYRFRNIDDAIDTNKGIEASPTGVKQWHKRALEAIMRNFKSNLQEFHERFGDVRASDFDWVYYNTRKGLTPEQIIGTTDPTTGRTINQNMIDAMKWWSEQPFTKKLRMGSLEALGKGGDFDTLGYLPHTNYDPSNLSYDEAVTGQLWRTFTGKSVIKDGRYVGYGGTLDGRYRTFASNMLWDIRGKEVAAAKLIEEAQLEGKTLTPEQAMKTVEGGKHIQDVVDDSPSTKKVEKKLSSNGGKGDVDWKEIDKSIKEEGPKSGLGKATHDVYQDVYRGANSSQVVSQPDAIGEIGLNQQSDIMRKIKIGNGMSMYDYGGADIVYASQNAIELVNRYMREGGDFRQMLVSYIESHSHRSTKYAEVVADRWIAKMNDAPGELTKGKAISELSKSMRSEAMGRFRKWLVMAEYDGHIGADGKRIGGFNDGTKKFIDDFLFRHMQMDSIKKKFSIHKMVTSSLNGIMGFRYRALFYGNFKNALLQVSELNRLFTVFKWGDVGKMLKRLATDENFRARVDTYVEAVSPETTFLKAEVYGKYQDLADSAKVDADGVTFGKLKGKADDIGLAPINAAENLKNRTMIAALVQEADSKKLTGDEALRYIRSKFERVALANNEMGRIGLSSNELAKPMLFLQKFQIRELGMHYYNIKDATGVGAKMPKKVLEATKYLTKVFGAKMATTLILSRLGYSASQTLGIDPFGLADDYNRLSEDEMNDLDKTISGGVMTPFFAGGMTSLIADLYFMARDAYEDSVRQTISDEAERELKEGDFWNDLRFWEQTKAPKEFSGPDGWLGLGADFVPGNVFLNRIKQMNEMRDTGWALSSTGNKMYRAPQDDLNTLLGYLFGRSATQNALQYNQTYGDDLGQTISRTLGKTLANMFGGGYQGFDPIDTKNYSDWFKGNEGDQQQFEKGKRYFRAERDRILRTYEDAIQDRYATDIGLEEAKATMNRDLEDLYNKIDRFVDAYERKNGSITGKMTKDIVNLLNQERRNINDTPEQAEKRGLEEYNKALERYSQLGLPSVGTYSGPSTDNPETREDESKKEVKYQGSPQWRVSSGSRWNINTEAAQVLAAGDAMLKDLRNEMKTLYGEAVQSKDFKEFNKRQKEYLEAFDNVVGPIVATYGNGIFDSAVVKDQLEKMLSTSTSSEKINLIPSEQYMKDKYGRYRSMPNESVDVGKWAKERYDANIFTSPTIRSSTTTEDDIDDIKRLYAQGNKDMAVARALSLKVRIDNQKRSISSSDYKWLLDFLNNGGK